MSSKTKLWLGVGTYLMVNAVPGIAIESATASPEGVVRWQADMAQAGTEADLCRQGPGGEGGEGGGTAPAPTTPTSLAAGVDAAALNQAVDQYEVYVRAQAEDLVQRVQDFTGKVMAGDVEGAKTLYPTSRIPWERIEPVAERFAVFDTSIDARVDDFQGETDPEFTGFHRIELGLFQNNSTDGLEPFAEKLMSDVVALQRCISVLQIEPRDMVVGAAELIEEVAQGKITGEEDRYSRTDFWSFHANVEGSMQIVDLLRPIVQTVNPQLLAEIDAGFAAVNQQLDRYRLPEGGFKTYDQLTPTDKQRLQASLASLAEDLANLRGVLGV